MYYQHIRDLEFPIEYEQVLRVTALRYRCSSSLERSQVIQPNIITTNNELHDDFFKVRPSSTSRQNSTNNGDRLHTSQQEEIEEEYGFYVDSDEDEEDDFDNTSRKLKQEQQPQNEAWSLVEVAPFIVSGRTAHNGKEGESIFQIGHSIMPGVMNMMESLSGNNVNNNTHFTSQLPDRNWLPRKKK